MGWHRCACYDTTGCETQARGQKTDKSFKAPSHPATYASAWVPAALACRPIHTHTSLVRTHIPHKRPQQVCIANVRLAHTTPILSASLLVCMGGWSLPPSLIPPSLPPCLASLSLPMTTGPQNLRGMGPLERNRANAGKISMSKFR